jgi:hypothetical protein
MMNWSEHAPWLAVFRAYLLWSALLHLVWEVLQLPLYTIWTTAGLGELTYAILHCTTGDVMIAASTLGAVLLAFQAWNWPRSKRRQIWLASLLLGVGYTVFSEWLNVELRESWAYSDAMPIVPILGTGLSPLLQWLVVPTVGQWIAMGSPPWRSSSSATA